MVRGSLISSKVIFMPSRVVLAFDLSESEGDMNSRDREVEYNHADDAADQGIHNHEYT